jgi:hypothetical protein
VNVVLGSDKRSQMISTERTRVPDASVGLFSR